MMNWPARQHDSITSVQLHTNIEYKLNKNNEKPNSLNVKNDISIVDEQSKHTQLY